MLTQQLKIAFDDAELVRFNERGTIAIVWYGGTTYAVYSVYDSDVHEIDVFSHSDERGCALDRDAALETIEDRLTQHP